MIMRCIGKRGSCWAWISSLWTGLITSGKLNIETGDSSYGPGHGGG